MPAKACDSSIVVYLAGPEVPAGEAQRLAANAGAGQPLWLSRRGTALGWIAVRERGAMPSPAAIRTAWQTMEPVFLPDFVAEQLPAQQGHIRETDELMAAVREGADFEDLLLQEPYASRLAPRLAVLSSIYNEGDPQEIVKVEFDVMDGGELVAENIWVKAAWLSFEEDDASMRFRFSFGMEDLEDVGADLQRELYAADLAEAIFPESAVISTNMRLESLLKTALQVPTLAYVERIVYFNAPDGGAQFHQDVERGHLGVVFAQLSGRTGWLALSKDALIDEIQAFTADSTCRPILDGRLSQQERDELLSRVGDRARLSAYLDDPDNDPLELLINRVPAFTRRLIDAGHGYVLNPGDVLLLPQQDLARCAWHAVFCIGDDAGEALSFAVRTVDSAV